MGKPEAGELKVVKSAKRFSSNNLLLVFPPPRLNIVAKFGRNEYPPLALGFALVDCQSARITFDKFII